MKVKYLIAAALMAGVAGCNFDKDTGSEPVKENENISSLNESEKKQPSVNHPHEEYSIAADMVSGGATRHTRKLSPQTAAEYGRQPLNRESYDYIKENGFKAVNVHPLSTFSADVDTASYSNLRRFLNEGRKPPVDAVRIEEMVNYFSYDYAEAQGRHPFSVNTTLSDAPWQKKHHLLRIGLKGRSINNDEMPARNLVFLLDVSGSMHSADKLPLLKRSLKLLVNQLNDKDRVSIVVYAGASGQVLEPTRGDNRAKILEAVNNLRAGGSTNGESGIQLAYSLAEKNLDTKGINRVILATDGDFNVGASDDGSLTRLIEKKRETGVFLTVLGFGTGNLNDSMIEKLADHGNGNYAYIDSYAEARKVLVEEAGSTLFTIARDVKFQVEFNPAVVKAYRLIGYENRVLNAEDFNDDSKDAGEIGPGHTVTALYEIVPAGADTEVPGVDELKYSRTESADKNLSEIATVKLRYKKPDANKSILMSRVIANKPVSFKKADHDTRFAASVAMTGMLLRNSFHKGNSDYNKAYSIARSSLGEDKNGYRAEFLRLIKLSQSL